jgi:anti-anti-sigma regulatory factor
MAGITMIDSTGLGELTSIRTAVAERGGDLKLLIPPAVASIPGIGQLPSGFTVFRDEKEAFASFGVAR